MQAPAELRGDGVRLRPLRRDDAPAYAQAFRDDPELGCRTGHPRDPDQAEILERIASERPSVELAITDGSSDGFLGVVIAHHVDEAAGSAELGFWLVQGARGAGLASRAVELLVGWLFGPGGLRVLALSTQADNTESIALVRRLGFVEQRTERTVERGQEVELVWFRSLREEWVRPTRR